MISIYQFIDYNEKNENTIQFALQVSFPRAEQSGPANHHHHKVLIADDDDDDDDDDGYDDDATGA